MRAIRKPGAALAVLASAAVVVAGCGSSSSSTSAGSASSTSAGSSAASSSTTPASSALGTPHKATGTPYVFGLTNDEAGPVTFPEARQGEIAAAAYVNDYLGGINGHPIQLADCISDASPATSARCATELVGKHPVAILGAADVGSPAALPVYTRANLAYIGGIPFTPVEQNAPNSVQFWSVSLGDNAAASVFAAKTLHAKSAAVLYLDNPQGKVSGLGIIPPTMKAAGITTIKTIGVPPTTPDPSPEVAAAVGAHPDVVYVDQPVNCGAVLKTLHSLGYSGKVLAIDPCTDPRVIASAAGGADGMYTATPFISPFGGSQQANIFEAAMAKYAASGTAIDSISTAGFATVVNLQQALSGVKGSLTTASILNAFKSGANHANFLSHPYTCNGHAIAKAVSICNDYYLMEQIQNGKPVEASTTDWVTSKGYFAGL
jgi:branched-chain amino acid transport system substrate-binding protein